MFQRAFIILVLLSVFYPVASVQARIEPGTQIAPPLEDVLLTLDTLHDLEEWVAINIYYDYERYEQGAAGGCIARTPKQIYQSGKAICTEYARLACYWAALHNAACYQVIYTTGQWAHAFAWLPEYRVTVDDGFLYEYETDDIAEIVGWESLWQSVCFIVLDGGSDDHCIYCHLS